MKGVADTGPLGTTDGTSRTSHNTRAHSTASQSSGNQVSLITQYYECK